MTKELLLEIGTEEIPAAFLPKAMKDMDDIIRRELDGGGIAYGKILTMATPRRLFLCVADVSVKQEDRIFERIGPAVRVAYDSEGNATKAAIGFARSQGVGLSQLEIAVTDKGEYLCVRKTVAGVETGFLLPEILPRFIASLPFRKSMRWSDMDFRFARPIHWIAAVFGGEVVPFSVENISSGNLSCGHRFMKRDRFAVRDLADYLNEAREHYVIVDPLERRKLIIEQADEAARSVGGKVLANEDLLQEVTFLVEYPTAVCGGFEATYLELPREVLVTCMISHQKYFPVVDEKGDLLPHFITINNTLARNPAVVTKGNEKVIRARLADARFFFQEDQKRPLAERLEDLKGVVFHTLLGTSFEKVARFRKIAAFLAEKIKPSLRERVDRAAVLAKTDLNTQMVGEFPDLQGIMGREYALRSGEDPVIAQAIYEHYLPLAAGGEIPETDEGAIVSIADKMDTIVGFFGVNLVPTGTADPYALRRQALGVIAIILGRQYRIDIADLVDKSLAVCEGLLARPREETRRDVLDFFRGRLENHFILRGYARDVTDAVLAQGFTDIVGSLKRIEAMEAFKTMEEYEPVAIAFKRVGNIIRGFSGGSVNASLFRDEEEAALHTVLLETKEKVLAQTERDDYLDALAELAKLRGPIDAFFDGVLVMADDEKIRFNRLSLLEEISKIFRRIADFSRITTEP